MQQSSIILKCPHCASSINSAETVCSFCGRTLSFRKCPYCKNTVPAEEDPCHYCGHLEPADTETIQQIYYKETKKRFLSHLLDFLDVLTRR